jgi:hypothetical protein
MVDIHFDDLPAEQSGAWWNLVQMIGHQSPHIRCCLQRRSDRRRRHRTAQCLCHRIERHDDHVRHPGGVSEPYGHRGIVRESQREPDRNLQTQGHRAEGHRVAEAHQQAMERELALHSGAPSAKRRPEPQHRQNAEAESRDRAAGRIGRCCQPPSTGNHASRDIDAARPAMRLWIFRTKSWKKLERAEKKGVCTENPIRVDDVMESPKLAE